MPVQGKLHDHDGPEVHEFRVDSTWVLFSLIVFLAPAIFLRFFLSNKHVAKHVHHSSARASLPLCSLLALAALAALGGVAEASAGLSLVWNSGLPSLIDLILYSFLNLISLINEQYRTSAVMRLRPATHAFCAVCILPLLPSSTCNQSAPAFGFDFTTGSCVALPSGGCNGTIYSFPTLAQCQTTCAVLDACDDVLTIEMWVLFNWNTVNATLKGQAISPTSWNALVQSTGGSYMTFFDYIIAGM